MAFMKKTKKKRKEKKNSKNRKQERPDPRVFVVNLIPVGFI